MTTTRFPLWSRRRLTALGPLALLSLLWSGCDAKEQTEYVAGISTQVRVPRDLRSVRLSVSSGGVRQFCQGYRVYDGRVQLPRSLGTYALNDPKQSGPLTYSLIGYTEDLEDGSEFDDLRCNDVVGKSGNARILRRSRQPYIENEIRFLPMPLKYACFDATCENESETCKGGLCVDAAVDAINLPPYTPELVDGSGADCFSIEQCLGAALPAAPVNPDDCTYAVANSKDAPPTTPGVDNPFAKVPSSGEGLNVIAVFDGGYVREVLDMDADDGFTIPDPAKPQQFRLSKGLCQLVHGYDDKGKAITSPHRITGLTASGTCRPKSPFQPICQAESLAQMGLQPDGTSTESFSVECKAAELKPPKALLLLVIDNTAPHHAFFDEAPEVTVGLTLADPAFSRTDIGLIYAPGNPADACSTTTAPVVPPEVARDAKAGVLAAFEQAPIQGEFSLDAALTRAYTLAAGGDYAKRAVLVIGNRDVDKDACPGAGPKPSDLAASAKAASPSIETHVILLAQPPDGVDGNAVLADAAKVGVDGFADGRGKANKANAADAFQKIIDSLATCVYDAPAIDIGDDGVLSYNDPISLTTRTIQHADGCTSENASANGWGKAGGKIFVCGQACTDYQATLKNAAFTNNALYQKPAPAMPMFAHKGPCAPKP